MNKQEIRKKIKQIKRQFSESQLKELSLPIIKKLFLSPTIQKANTIGLYYSLPDEVDTHDLIDILLQKGKKIILPKVIDDSNIEMREYSNSKDMEVGSYHIQEPIGKNFEDYSSIDVIIVPGVAFDNQGNRLGRGKGYYDRFLKKIPATKKIGICFDFQMIEQIPTEKNDIPMDDIITN